MALAGIKDCAYSAAAKHVSAEGCQFVLGCDDAVPGQRFRFDLTGCGPVFGTVKWSVSDRIGFAFDHPLCSESLRVLIGRGDTTRGVELLPA